MNEKRVKQQQRAFAGLFAFGGMVGRGPRVPGLLRADRCKMRVFSGFPQASFFAPGIFTQGLPKVPRPADREK